MTANFAGYRLIRYTAGSVVPTNAEFVTPRKRSALEVPGSAAKTLLMFALFLAVFGAWFAFMDWLQSLSLWAEIAVLVGVSCLLGALGFGAVVVAKKLLPSGSGFRPTYGSLSLSGSVVVQSSESEPPLRIDATRPYEYSILDRYDVSRAVFRLYQGGSTLTFRFSDPGGRMVVRDVMGLKWPPPARHAGRSYAPPAV